MKPERVLTVNDYYDGPRLGIAEVNGIPHIYEAEFDHSTDEYGDTYFVSPVSDELLALVLEDWAIWLRWNAAYKRNEVTIESHPALPHERARHEQLKTAIGNRIRSDPNNRAYLRARFGYVAAQGDWDGTTVEWRKP
ncbi:hypothetical protein [Noviherbaspirillum sp. UKPF54]|uniref:hypothetical protein n=1 Tax=Noviherbaspirillum sp. UKPF54 TaxID=2601898 RepID=UPI0011B16F1D|nr:hypothetical protein [Noviherbaspirillum sp. UKPF54]QDZ29346.1 hypothetical protein FAY22_16095 [Noviherbaspirillum sp. UKPF54]